MTTMGILGNSYFSFLVAAVLVLISSSSYGFPGASTRSGNTGQGHMYCAAGCQMSCRGSSDITSSPKRFCYCRCKTAIDYGTLVYTAVVDDIWQIRCGYLGHPFVSTALAMNESALLDEFAVTRCESDYSSECRNGDPSEVCSQWWAASLCLETCADFVSPVSAGTTVANPSTSATTTNNEMNGLCPPDKYFRSQKPTFGNPYTGCTDFQRECNTLYDRGYCQLKPGAVNCQETCGRCVGDDAYMPWNPIRSQLIQWAMNRRDDGTAKTLMNYFMRQYSDFISEVHRSCRTDVSSLESEHRQQTQRQHQHRRRHEHRDAEQDV